MIDFKKFLCVCIALLSLFALNANAYTKLKVAVLIPMEHQALNDIASGFKQTLENQYGSSLVLKIANAQNDQNLQRAIIQQMGNNNYNLIVSIGTQATLMTMGMLKQKPIVGIAVDSSQIKQKKSRQQNIAVVDDEIPSDKSIEFIHRAYPNIKNIVLIHSSAEKILPEVSKAKEAANKVGVIIKNIIIQNLMDLQSVARSLPSETHAIFILRDNLVVSGVPQLVHVASSKKIPLIASDEGSVLKGANFAVGVSEYQIGVKGGEVALEILNGKDPENLAIAGMDDLFVFINKNNQQHIEKLINTAKDLNYQIKYIT